MKINGNEIRPGNVIQHKGALWVAVKTQHVKPGNKMPATDLSGTDLQALLAYLESLK